MASNKINSNGPLLSRDFSLKQKIRLWLNALFHVKQSDRELDFELRFHLEKRVEAGVRAGMSQQDARQAALREFGSVDLAKEECRDERGMQFFEQFWQDVRFGLRMLRKNPGFTAVAVLTLALGIGANTAIFSVVNSVLLRPLPYPEPSQLVEFQLRLQRGDSNGALTVPQFQFFRDHTNAFQGVTGFRGGPDLKLKQSQTVDWVTSLELTDDFFRVLGASPAMGREFVRDETRPGGPATVMLSNEIWRKTFGADPEIIGRQIDLDDKNYTVVGVMPHTFRFVEGPADVFTPLHLGTSMSDKGMNTEVIARLEKNENVQQAQADMAVVYEQFHRQDTSQGSDTGVQLIGYQESLVSDVKPSLLMLFGAVGFLLLVASANVASLLLARSSARQTEVAIRLALGARRGRLLRQFITESLLMALLGGVAGLLAANWVLKTLTASIPFILPSSVSVNLDGSVLAFTFLLAVLTSIVFGLASFWQTSKLDLHSSLKESSKGSAGIARNRTGKALVIVEVALSVTMMIGAGLLIESLYRLRHQDMGFDPRNVITMTTPFTPPKGTPSAAVWNSQQQIMNRIKALPGVVSVAVVNVPPLMGWANMPAQREGHDEQSIGGMEIRRISQDYFKTLRIPILQGRGFLEGDNESSAPVVVINETVARTWWKGANPIGDHVVVGMSNGKRYTENPQPLEVVGVVADVKTKTIAETNRPTIYIPTPQAMSDGSRPPHAWVIRTEKEANISAELRAIVNDVNPSQRVELLLSMQQVIGISVAAPNFDMLLMSLFAGLGLLLTAVGIYGVLSFTVAQRTHEIGIRMALGARQIDVLRLVVGQGMVLAWMGIGMGILAALGLTRFLETLLFNVRPIDAPAYAAVAVALTIVALLASYVPARRAMRVDPITALRNE